MGLRTGERQGLPGLDGLTERIRLEAVELVAWTQTGAWNLLSLN